MSEITRALEQARQEEKLAGAIVLGNLIAKIVMTPVPRRVHWWQFWRQR